MAEIMELTCPECTKAMKVPGTMAGKKVRCKGCGHVFRVEAPSPSRGRASAKTSVKAKPSGKGKPAPRTNTKADAKGKAKRRSADDDDNDPNPYGVSKEDFGPQCPYCAAKMDEDDVVCIECGYNLETRERHTTRKVAERNFNDWFLWLFPAIMGLFITLSLVGFDVWYFLWTPKPEEADDFFIWAITYKGVKLWVIIGTLFVMFVCVVYAFKRLVLNPVPPERSKPMEFSTVVSVMAALGLGTLMMVAAICIPIILLACGFVPGFLGCMLIISLFSSGYGICTGALQYNKV
jgi:hypothetical protein